MLQILSDYLRRADINIPVIRTKPKANGRTEVVNNADLNICIRNFVNSAAIIYIKNPFLSEAEEYLEVLVTPELTCVTFTPLTLHFMNPTTDIAELFAFCFPDHQPIRYEEYIYIPMNGSNFVALSTVM